MVWKERKRTSHQELLKEFEWAKDNIPDSEVPQPAPDEFEKVWKRIQDGE